MIPVLIGLLLGNPGTILYPAATRIGIRYDEGMGANRKAKSVTKKALLKGKGKGKSAGRSGVRQTCRTAKSALETLRDSIQVIF
jgi:hypothetical protein